MKRKLCFIYGTRPEIIKLSPVIKLCLKNKVPFFSIHTGQHYSYLMDKMFLEELNLPPPKYELNIKSKAAFMQGYHTGRMLIGIEKILLSELPYCVVVQGDTNTVLAGALAAKKITTTKIFTGLDIKVAHVEAGLRSYDESMPEEYNRIVADHFSDLVFVPTYLEKKILLKEGIPKHRIYITGNTIVDALTECANLAMKKVSILERLGLRKGSYILLTLHRQENVDSKKIFSDIIKGLTKVILEFKMPIIFPAHPRTAKKLNLFKLKMPDGIIMINPTSFLDFLSLEANAALVMTDSGGVQEEACILKVPCVTLRNNTERPQTISVGANIIAGTRPDNILGSALKAYSRERKWANPFGDGKTAGRIVKLLRNVK